MGPLAKKLLNDWPYCALTQPLAGTAVGGCVGGVYAGLCGTALGILEGLPRLPQDAALRGTLAGGLAGLLIGLYSVVDRATSHRP
jgi:hypothetical protein